MLRFAVARPILRQLEHWPVLIPLLLALLAFWQVLGFQYTGRDSSGWILSSDLNTPEGLRWSLASPHYVGYRPLTALSYGLDSLRSKEPAAYHQTNLVVHLLDVVLAYALGALLLGRPAGTVVAVIVGIHPVTAHVVPVLARRGDLLVSAFSAVAVLLALRGRWIACGVVSGAAFACKEVAVVLPPLLSLVSYLVEPDRKRRVRSAARTGAAAVAGVAVLGLVRLLLLQRVGGYPSGERANWFQIAAEFLANLWLPTARMLPVSGHEDEWSRVFLLLAVSSVAISLRIGLRRDQPVQVRNTALIGATWLGLLLSLHLFTEFFEVRLLYPSLLPLALIVCAPLRSSRLGLPLAALPFAITLFALLSGPLVRGVPEWAAASRYHANALESLGGKLTAADKLVVVLNYPSSVRFDPAFRVTRFRSVPPQLERDNTFVAHLGIWLAARKGSPELKVRELNSIVFDGPDVVIPLVIEEDGRRLVVTLDPGAYRSYQSSELLDGQQKNAPNQPFVKTRRELHIPKSAKLFVFDGRGGELRDFPEELELAFAPR